MHATKIASALRLLADALEEGGATILQEPKGPSQSTPPAPLGAGTATAPPAAPKRGRGRPVAGEAPAAPAAAPEAPAPVATPPVADPFADRVPATPEVLSATLDDVRTALTALRDATNQETAVAILKTIGQVDNLSALKPERYRLVAAAAKAALPAAKTDPFETPVAVATPEPTLEDVKAAIVRVQKRASTETAQKIVMAHGGKAAGANGVVGPSLKALPLDQIAACLKALDAVPATK